MPPSSPYGDVLLREVIESVCIDHLEPSMQQKLSQLGPLNLFVIVSGKSFTVSPFRVNTG